MPTTSVRTQSDVIIEQLSWDLWAYVRDNATQLDSEMACKIIQAGMNAAVAKLGTIAIPLGIEAENARLKALAVDLERENKRSAKEYSEDLQKLRNKVNQYERAAR